jgi:replicative DNA helicase
MPSDRELYPLYIKTGYAYLIINVAKQRDGVTGSFPLLYNPARQTYIEIARGDAPK